MIDISVMSPEERLIAALDSIDGVQIEKDLIEFAAIGGAPKEGRPDQPIRHKTGRIALTEIDIEARNVLACRLDVLPVDVYRHPMGIIAVLIGSDPDKQPVGMWSHTDTVPEGDMYDGVVGVLGGLVALEAIIKYEVPHDRTIILVGLTGEESSGFGTALFGSKVMFNGMDEDLANARLTGQPSIAEVVEQRFGEDGLMAVRDPLFGEGRVFPLPFAGIELHVEQNDQLELANIDLGVVDRIAAPVRHELTFGANNPLEPDTKEYEHVEYFELVVIGKADHSGARPMGDENRADGLVETARTLKEILEFDGELGNGQDISIGEINIDAQAINKVPGVTKTQIRVTAVSKAALEAKVKLTRHFVSRREQYITERMPRFDDNAVSLIKLEEPKGVFFNPKKMNKRHIDFFESVLRLSELATAASADKVVGTIGTVSTSKDGVITAGVDVRGVDAVSRDEVFEGFMYYLWKENSGKLGTRKAGDSDPVIMDPSLVVLTSEVIDQYNIGSHQVMFSAAGHDAQNSQRAGIPTALIFIPSENGVAHNPNAYTAPRHLAKGVRALLATVVKLANS